MRWVVALGLWAWAGCGSGGGGGGEPGCPAVESRTVTIDSPVDGGEVTGVVLVTATVTEPCGVRDVTFAVDSEPLGSVQEPPFELSWDTSTAVVGDHVLDVSAVDDAGVTTSARIRVVVARACDAPSDCPPTVRITYPVDGSAVCGTLDVEAVASDAEGIARVEFDVDGASLGSAEESPYRRTWESRTGPDGSHWLRAVATDTGGLSAQAMIQVDVLNEGVEACDNLPSISFTSPGEAAYLLGDVLVGLEASDDAGVRTVEVFVDGGRIFEDESAPYEGTWVSDDFDEGPHLLRAIATDTSDQTSLPATLEVTIDRTPPDVSITSPAAESVFEGEVPLAAVATDEFALDRVLLQVCSPEGCVDFEKPEPPFEDVFDGTDQPSGPYTVQATAWDRAGSSTSTPLRTFYLDRPPSVRFSAPGDGDVLEGVVQVRVELDDDLGLDRAVLRVDGAGNVDLLPDGVVEWDTNGQDYGEHVLRAEVTDSHGHEESDEIVVFVDQPPAIALSTADCPDAVCVGTVTLVAEVTDDGPGVDTVDFLLDDAPAASLDAAPYELAWDSTETSDGDHTWRAIVYTTDARSAEASLVVSVSNCDADGDGVQSAACGGNDCDDGDVDVHTGALYNFGEWTADLIDTIGENGSLGIDGSGMAFVSYSDFWDGDLYFATNESGAWVTTRIALGAGLFTSLALDSDGDAHISYHRGGSDLGYATNASGAWVFTTVDSLDDTGQQSSIALDSAGAIHIAYQNWDADDLRYATNASGAWVKSVIDVSGVPGYGVELALDSANHAHIGHYENSFDHEARYITNATGAWVSRDIDPAVGRSSFGSIAVDSADQVYMAYQNVTDGHLRYATYAGGVWTRETVDAGSTNGAGASLAFDGTDTAHITFEDATREMVVYAVDLGSSWWEEDVAAEGEETDLVLDADGVPHVVYHVGHDLYYAVRAVPDGVDQNCDGIDGLDADGDGHAATPTGGDDCDDDASDVYPGAPEPVDGIDQDCNGVDG